MQLKAEIMVKALLRRAHIAGVFAAITQRGDADAGVILVKVALMDGRAIVHAPALAPDGGVVWMTPLGEAPSPERDADAYLARRRDRDPDAWVVEIEDRFGRAFLFDG